MNCPQTDNVLQNFHDELKQLALKAQQHPPFTEIRQEAMTELIEKMMNSEQLWYPHPSQLDEEAYRDAQQNLWLYVCQAIEKYNPELGSVITWVNMLMYRRFYREARAKSTNKHIKNLSDFDLLLNNFFLVDARSVEK